MPFRSITPPGRSSPSHNGPSRSTNAASAPSSIAGAIPSDEHTMHPIINPNPFARAAFASASASVKPPVLSSLMFTTS